MYFKGCKDNLFGVAFGQRPENNKRGTMRMRYWSILAAALGAMLAASAGWAGDFSVVQTVKVGSHPHGIRMDAGRLYIAHTDSDDIWVLDGKTLEVREKWPLENSPLGLIKGGRGWIVAPFSGDSLIELDNHGIPSGRRWPVGKGPSLFVPKKVGGRAYIVSEFADRFTVFDTGVGAELRHYKVARQPYPADVTADGVLAFVPSKAEGVVTVIDLLNEKELARVAVCPQPEGGAFSADEVSYLVACNGSNEVVWINTASFKVTGRLKEGIGPRAFSVVTTGDGRFAFVNNVAGGTVSVIDMATRSFKEQIPVGAAPIVMRLFGQRLFVSNENSGTLSVIGIPPAAKKAVGDKNNDVLVLGMIHGQFNTSKRYSLDVLRRMVRAYGPDYVLAEIPPNRFHQAMASFRRDGRVEEPRVERFPEYIDMLFPLTRELDFTIIPTAGWNRPMSDYRNVVLSRIEKDPARAAGWQRYEAAIAKMDKAMKGRDDDPYFIHSPEYDALTKAGLGPYDELFNDDIGPGGWTTINQAHYANIERALEQLRGQGKRILITYGAGHKYWFLERLRQRTDIRLVDAKPFIDKALAEGR